MTTSLLSHAFPWACLLFFSGASVALAQANNPPPPTVPMAAYLAAKEAHKTAMFRALDAVQATIAAEVELGMAVETRNEQMNAVENFRGHIKNGGAGTMVAGYLGAGRKAVAAESAARIDEAWKAFNDAASAQHAFRLQIQPLLRDYATSSAIVDWRKAVRAEDLAPALETLRIVREMELESGANPDLVHVESMANLLTASQRFLEALADGEPMNLSNTYKAMISTQTNRVTLITVPEIDRWRRRFAQKSDDELKVARLSIEQLIVKRASSSELLEAVQKIAVVSEKVRAFEDQRYSAGGGQFFSAQNLQNFLRNYALMVGAIEQKNWASATQLSSELKATSALIGSEALKVITEQRTGVAPQWKAAEAAARAATDEQLRKRLAAVTDRASLLKLADELRAESSANSGPRENNDLTVLEQELRQIAALWNADSPQPISSQAWRQGQPDRAWSADVDTLRKRAVREALASRLQLPELLQPPLNALSPARAVRQHGRDLFAKGDFARVQSLLAQSSLVFTEERVGGETEEMRGLKLFLTAQNLERAEQFADAVRIYRDVLSCIGELVPSDAAAERLRTLKREQPDAFKSLPNLPPSAVYFKNP